MVHVQVTEKPDSDVLTATFSQSHVTKGVGYTLRNAHI
jgi:hypothetical protein